MFDHIARHFLPEFFYKEWTFRPRPHHRHIAFQHIEKLRQLIDAGFAHKSAPFRLAGVIFGGPLFPFFLIGLHMHRAKLIHHKMFPVQPHPFLMKHHRAGRSQLNHDNRQQHQRRGNQNGSQRKYNIKGALQAALEPVIQRHPAGINHTQPVQVIHVGLCRHIFIIIRNDAALHTCFFALCQNIAQIFRIF